MMRYWAIIGFLVVLAVPLVARSWLRVAPAALPVASGVDSIVVVTPDTEDIRREFARAFAQWHKDKYGTEARIDFRSVGGTADIRRQLDTIYRSYRDSSGKLPPESEIHPDIDVVFGGGDFMFDQQLKPAGELRPIPMSVQELHEIFPDATLAGVRLYDWSQDANGNDQPAYWVGGCLSSFGIVYNADVCRSIDIHVPETWVDLTDMRFAGLLAMADPTHSGSAAAAYMMVLQRAMADAEGVYLSAHPEVEKLPALQRTNDAGYNAAIANGWQVGMGRLVLIAANARYFTDSSSVVPTDVGNGEAAAGLAIDYYGRVVEQTVGAERAKYVSPVAATAITPDSIAIPYGVQGHRLELATQFIEFVLSKQGQLLWDLKAGTAGGPVDRALRRLPIRRDVYTDQTNWADPVNPFVTAGGFNQRAKWSAMLGDTMVFWAVEWIDTRDDLTAAYRRILAVPDPARRGELLAKLAALPVTMADLQQYASDRKNAEKTGDVDAWRADARIALAKKIGQFYRDVGESAKDTP